MNKRCKSANIIAGTGLTFVILCFYACRLSVPVISDETVTMANAAWLRGYDWSWMIAAVGGRYYRFGQALMTLPFFALLDDPAMIYRLSMVLQAAVQTSIVPVVYIISRKYLNVESPCTAVLLGMGVCLVPSMALYTFYYRGDYLLGVLPWYALLTFLETVRAGEKQHEWRRMFCTVMTVFFCVLAYMAHTRGIVLSIAVLLCAFVVGVVLKKRSLHWPLLFLSSLALAALDTFTGQMLKDALYSISGLTANALESTDMGAYFNFFSPDLLKDQLMLALSWLCTLMTTTQGLVLFGMVVGFVFLWKLFLRKQESVSAEEKIVALFSMLVYAGYFAVGTLFFKGTYSALSSAALENRVDRLLYDRYAICGAGMVIFLALYAFCCRRELFSWKGKAACVVAYGGILGIFIWKIFPIAVRYPGYIYNTITLNTFNTVNAPENILSGEYYTRTGMLGALLLGAISALAVLVLSFMKKKWMPYVLLCFVLVSDLALIHVNYGKIRKAANDYVVDATHDVVAFMQDFEEDAAEEFPYILKGGISGIKIQFYQSQLMQYKMFGKNQMEQLAPENFFIISDHEHVAKKWNEGDYYLFEDFDYKNAKNDIVYVKGKKLMKKMESLGYEMVKYKKALIG